MGGQSSELADQNRIILYTTLRLASLSYMTSVFLPMDLSQSFVGKPVFSIGWRHKHRCIHPTALWKLNLPAPTSSCCRHLAAQGAVHTPPHRGYLTLWWGQSTATPRVRVQAQYQRNVAAGGLHFPSLVSDGGPVGTSCISSSVVSQPLCLSMVGLSQCVSVPGLLWAGWSWICATDISFRSANCHLVSSAIQKCLMLM